MGTFITEKFYIWLKRLNNFVEIELTVVFKYLLSKREYIALISNNLINRYKFIFTDQ